MKHILPLSLLLIGPAVSYSQTVNPSEAMARAMRFLQPQAHTLGIDHPSLSLAHTAAMQDETYYYAFNVSGGGFIIVGGDAVAQEILGFSHEGTFDPSQMPENMKWWLNQYEQQISYAIQQVRAGSLILADRDSDANHSAQARRTPAAYSDVLPLLGESSNAIQWGQDKPFNLAIDGGHGDYVTGCVATAGAQVMRYYQHPLTDEGLRYDEMLLGTVRGNQRYAPAITADYTYAWSDMQPQYYNHSSYHLSDPDVKDLANLMYRIGRSINATFGTSTTSASLRELGKKMIHNFGYDKTLTYDQRSYYSDSQWEDKIHEELEASRPVLYGASDIHGGGGHAFVCDGYNALYQSYHINWGWTGLCDGYFKLTGTNALKPSDSGTGGAGVNAEYIMNQEILSSITPDEGNDYRYNMVCSDISLSQPTIKRGKTVALEGLFWNYSYADYQGAIGLGFFEKGTEGGGIVATYHEGTLHSFYGYHSIQVPMPDALASDHEYEVYPMYKENGVWQYFHLNEDCEVPVLTVIEPDRTIKGWSMPWTITTSTLPLGSSYGITEGGFGNDGEVESTITFGFRFMNVANPDDCAYSESFTRTLAPGYYVPCDAEHPVVIDVPVSLTIGETYTVTSMYKDNEGEWKESRRWQTYDDPDVMITQPEALILADLPCIKNEGYFTADDLEIRFNVLNSTGNDISGKTIVVWFFPAAGGKSVDYAQFSNQSFADGESREFTVKYSNLKKKELNSGKDYFFLVQNNTDSYYLNQQRISAYMRLPLQISYQPTLGQWGTLCLPYEAEVPEGFTAYQVTGTAEGMILKEEVEIMEMNHPYLIQSTEGETTIFSGPTTPTGSYANGLLYGITDNTIDTFVPAGSYHLMQGEQGQGFYLIQNAEEQPLQPYGAYLKTEVIETEFLLIEGPQDDAIQLLHPDVTPSRAYNLHGQPIRKSDAHGIQINNGRIWMK